MRNILAIMSKETKTYFTAPVAYIIGMVFVAITGVFFSSSLNVPFPEAVVSPYLVPSSFVLVLLSPILTMRLIAEEQKLGTIELLLTSPIRDWEIVFGKFLASLVFFIFTLTLTLYFVGLLFWYGNPEVGPIFTSYLGFLLYGAATLSIGLLASSFTNNQIVAASVSFGILLILTFIGNLSGALGGMAARVTTEISLVAHYDDFSRGIIDTGDLVFYLSVIALSLFLTTRALESQRWR